MHFRDVLNHVQGELKVVPEVEKIAEQEEKMADKTTVRRKRTIRESRARRLKVREQKRYATKGAEISHFNTLISRLTRERKVVSGDIRAYEKAGDTDQVEGLQKRLNEIDYKIKRLNEKIKPGTRHRIREAKEEEMCRCGKAKVEKGYDQCTQCLDRADDEKYRHENESKNALQLKNDLLAKADALQKKIAATDDKDIKQKLYVKLSDINFQISGVEDGSYKGKQIAEEKVNEGKCKDCGKPIDNEDGLCDRCSIGSRYVEESKVNEDSGLLAGGSTQANSGSRAQDPNFGAPDPVNKPDPIQKDKAPTEPQAGEQEPEELPIEGEKEYLGNKGGEEYFYFVIIPAEDGTKDLQIQDAEDEVVFSAKENQIDTSNNEDFLWKGIQELQLSNIATEIVDKYLLPDEAPEDIEKEEGKIQTGDEQDQPETEEPKESGVIPELGAPAFKSTVESKVKECGCGKKKKRTSRKMTTIKELKMRRLLCKYELNEDFADGWKIGDNIDPLGVIATISPEQVTFKDAQGRITGILIRASAEAPIPPEVGKRYGTDTGKFYNVDMDKLYKTGDVGETKMLEKLMEKYGLTDTNIDLLLEKYGLTEAEGKGCHCIIKHAITPEEKEAVKKQLDYARKIGDSDVVTLAIAQLQPCQNESMVNEAEGDILRAPKNVEDLEKSTGDLPQTADVPPGAGEPGPEPGMGTPGAVEPAPEGGEPKAEEMLSADSAEADLKMKYPEEPYTTTAMAYADSLIDDPKVYGGVRNLKWPGVYANAETFLKQAKIVGNYNEFSPDIAKRLVDAIGEGAKFRLAREGSVSVYFTIRDPNKKISLATLRDLVRADEADATGNPGEARLWWD